MTFCSQYLVSHPRTTSELELKFGERESVRESNWYTMSNENHDGENMTKLSDTQCGKMKKLLSFETYFVKSTL